MRLLLQFHHPLIYVLLVAAAVTFAIGEPVDASVILGVVIANAAIGFVQEARAERALDALAAMMTVEAHVIRDGDQAARARQGARPGGSRRARAGRQGQRRRCDSSRSPSCMSTSPR